MQKVFLVIIFFLLSFLILPTSASALDCGGKTCVDPPAGANCEVTRGMETCPVAAVPNADSPSLTELGAPGPAVGGATNFKDIFGTITPPTQLGDLRAKSGKEAISSVIQTIIQLIYMVSGVIFLFMILISGVQWIVSGGNKESIAAARGRLTWAIIGITVLALAFLIVRVISVITGFEFFIV